MVCHGIEGKTAGGRFSGPGGNALFIAARRLPCRAGRQPRKNGPITPETAADPLVAPVTSFQSRARRSDNRREPSVSRLGEAGAVFFWDLPAVSLACDKVRIVGLG